MKINGEQVVPRHLFHWPVKPALGLDRLSLVNKIQQNGYFPVRIDGEIK